MKRDELRLVLERPYKTTDGKRLATLVDVSQDGQQIYEEKENPKTKLGKRLQKFFSEKPAFFEEYWNLTSDDQYLPDADESKVNDTDSDNTMMTTSKLLAMRRDMLPQLYIALGEMSHARDLLTLLLSTSKPSDDELSLMSLTGRMAGQPRFPVPNLPNAPLSCSIISKPPSISSLTAFNAQLALGSKDASLRKAAQLLAQAAESTRHLEKSNRNYWECGHEIRAASWGLIPAPLPYGGLYHHQGRSAERSTKDCLISFGLESAPPIFRRQAVTHLSRRGSNEHDMHKTLDFPHRQNTRLLVSYITIDPSTGEKNVAESFFVHDEVNVLSPEVNDQIRCIQREVIEKELFRRLLDDCTRLPSSSARVSERVIEIEAIQGIDLRFELLTDHSTSVDGSKTERMSGSSILAAVLPLLLLRYHATLKAQRLSEPLLATVSAVSRAAAKSEKYPVSILRAVIVAVQYHVFCNRFEGELLKLRRSLDFVGLECKSRFNRLGVFEGGKELVDRLAVDSLASGSDGLEITSEAHIRIDSCRTLRFTLAAPSTLIAHLPQATLNLLSISQLRRFLSDEIEEILLQKSCRVGESRIRTNETIWFVDALARQTTMQCRDFTISIRFMMTDDYEVVCHTIASKAGKGLGLLSQDFFYSRGLGHAEKTVFDWLGEAIDHLCRDQTVGDIFKL